MLKQWGYAEDVQLCLQMVPEKAYHCKYFSTECTWIVVTAIN